MKKSSLILLQWVCVIFLLAFVVSAKSNIKIFNVKKFGAVANGKTDCSKALLNAWQRACTWKGGAMVRIPSGNYYVGRPTSFVGPCKGKIQFEIKGLLKAPTGISGFSDTWIKFRYVNGLIVYGGGTLDGQGHSAWKYNDCHKNTNCRNLPANLRFDFVTDAIIDRIHSLDSKSLHINLFACRNVNLKSITITAPAESPNTDGIHIGDSSFINILHSKIGTGDDCISLSPGSENIYVYGVTCGPGHGISVGSLGQRKNEESVLGLVVKNCTFIGTDNGVRIKTWAPSEPGLVRNLTFDHIFMDRVLNPVVIDQQYCPYQSCAHKSPSRVRIQDVHYRNIWGTSASKTAVNFVCSKSVPCKYVELKNINLLYHGKDGKASANCSNLDGFAAVQMIPPCYCR
ncbi:hypothetical protein AQUCO_01900045v1 [Aquilegia coerulea]|uniref:Exopolygalacturonase-like n=1 Tax=Aquilegia coerulea TaxID=218851 RepID=A0A2G5DIR2_AQUCA|nr:hypothetical protein AQUCO_01900045v1 [Aquilegia coerulea]